MIPYQSLEPETAIVVAYDRNRVIGKDNALPWGRDMPSDMRRFRELTLGHAVIMGRHTFESIGRPLAGRLNIILSRQALTLTGCIVRPSLDDAFEAASDSDKVFVIGGVSVYEEALPIVETVYATEIDTTTVGGDTFFPSLSPDEWNEYNAESHAADQQNRYNYRFVTYRR